MPSSWRNTLVAVGEQLDHVAEVMHRIVHRGGGKQEQLLGPVAGVQVSEARGSAMVL